jgi:SRSO17 transposase
MTAAKRQLLELETRRQQAARNALAALQAKVDAEQGVCQQAEDQARVASIDAARARKEREQSASIARDVIGRLTQRVETVGAVWRAR